jgi:hypothetical protein
VKTPSSFETFYASFWSASSMNHRAGLECSQRLLFPEALEDYVAAENPVRFLDAFVASLNLHALGFDKARCADTGRPPYDPVFGGGAEHYTPGCVCSPFGDGISTVPAGLEYF